MVASYQVREGSFAAGEPRAWTSNPLTNFSTTRAYDPAPDGNRIVALMAADVPLSGGTI